MVCVTMFSFLFLLIFLGVSVTLANVRPCYDELNKPQSCYPDFENAAFGKPVEATNICGMNADVEYCWLNAFGTGASNCSVCSHQPSVDHTSAITDDQKSSTWWQSETLVEGIDEKTVNLTIHLQKAFDITYVTLEFLSPRPESFAILKRMGENEPWESFQFYSASCKSTYGIPDSRMVRNIKAASCISRHSDIMPLSGGSVSFSSLEGRWGISRNNQDIEDWVKATDLRIMLTRLNTFGDEATGDPDVMKSYFYAISDLSIGARCTCNGHGNECRKVQDPEKGEKLECVCQHFTTGKDCERCLPFYNDKPWRRATEFEGYQCEACECNGLSEECVFDPDIYASTGHGGRCINCGQNTAGNHCELCQDNYYRVSDKCEDCRCNTAGSTSLQCDENGQCSCKENIEGLKCDRCGEGYFGSVESGCTPCVCVVAGSQNDGSTCDSTTGQCTCKENVDGRRCDRCKSSFFDLSEDNPLGCVACFCHGHSTECTSADGFYSQTVMSIFRTGREGWTAATLSNQEIETKYNGFTEKLGLSSGVSEPVYFIAPDRFLGDQRFSYNQFLRFDMNIGEGPAQPSDADVVLEGSDLTVTISITGQSNPSPGVAAKSFAFRLHEHPDYQWKPTLESSDFIKLLSSLTAVKIRATYNSGGVGFLDNVELTTASEDFGGLPATWVESCSCPDGFGGHSCETCSDGFTRGQSLDGNADQCVPCQCNGHSDHCNPDNGRCSCRDNTAGDHCEICASGFHGNATTGTKGDCTPCPCTSGSSCIPVPNGEVICVDFDEVKNMKDKILVLEEKSQNAAKAYKKDQAEKNIQIQRLEDKVERLTTNFNKLSSATEDIESDVQRISKKTKDIVKTFKKVYGIRV